MGNFSSPEVEWNIFDLDESHKEVEIEWICEIKNYMVEQIVFDYFSLVMGKHCNNTILQYQNITRAKI